MMDANRRKELLRRWQNPGESLVTNSSATYWWRYPAMVNIPTPAERDELVADGLLEMSHEEAYGRTRLTITEKGRELWRTLR